jgi:hypothetical protein
MDEPCGRRTTRFSYGDVQATYVAQELLLRLELLIGGGAVEKADDAEPKLFLVTKVRRLGRHL